MSISNYTPPFCEYKRSKLKDVVYLLTEEDYHELMFHFGRIYNYGSIAPIALSCHNVEFTEEETLEERFKFTKTLKFTMNGYNNIDTLNGGLYAIIFTTEGGSFLVNSEFPPKITYNYNLSDTQDETQFTLYSQSNIPSVEVLPNIEPTISIDCEYKGYGIDTINFVDKDYASLNENTNTITLYDGATVKDVEWLEGSCSFQESFDGERVIDTITFDIDMDTWDSTWHLKLLEFNKNRYSAIVTPKYHSSKFIVGFNFGLQASYSTYATNENGQNNKITITFKETSKNGVHIAQSVSYATNSEKSWQYVQKVLADGNYEVDAYECIDTNIARYLVQEEVDSNNNPTGRYKVFSGYSGSFGDLLNVVGTFNEDVRFFTTKCSWYCPPQYQWVVVSGEYECSGTTKMTREKKQVSYDGGINWNDTDPLETRGGSVIEYNSEDCGYVPPTRWVVIPDEYECSGTTKMTREKKQVSYDGGVTWEDVVPIETRAGSVIEYESKECGCIPSDLKVSLIYADGRSAYTECNGNESLVYADLCPDDLRIIDIETAYIGRCVTRVDEAFGFNYTHHNYTSLKHAYIPDTVTYLNFGHGCDELLDIVIPNSVITVGGFDGCVSLTSVTFGNSVERIMGGNEWIILGAFEGCSSLTNVVLPNSITFMGASAFKGCTSLTSINIPTGLTEIKGGTFMGCTNLPSIILHEGITKIGTRAFENCTSLSSVTIPSTVTAMGDRVFCNCSGLTSVTVLATTPPTKTEIEQYYWVAFDNTNNCPIYVPSESVNAYKNAWWRYADRIQALP